MKSVKVTYRTIEPGPDVNGQPSTRMIVKTVDFVSSGVTESRRSDGRPEIQQAGYQIDGPFLRVYGSRKTLLVQKAEVLEVVADE